MEIPSHPTHSVIDSTKLKAFMTCPRRFMWEYVFGWRIEGSGNSIHLVFGQAWHEAMEILLNRMREDGKYSEDAVAEAHCALTDKYREYFTEDMDFSYAPKDPGSGLVALKQYIARYIADPHDFDVLKTEIAGTVPIADNRSVHFKIDAICKDRQDRLFALEHKTTGAMTAAWPDQWPLSVQVNTYIHALYCMAEDEQVYGAQINGAVLRKKGHDFIRVPVRRTPENMEGYLQNVNQWMDQIEYNMDLLRDAKPDDTVMLAFPMNTESCHKYNTKCPYHDFCVACPNPLRYIGDGEQTQPGFEIDFWDPRKNEKEAKEVVHIK